MITMKAGMVGQTLYLCLPSALTFMALVGSEMVPRYSRFAHVAPAVCMGVCTHVSKQGQICSGVSTWADPVLDCLPLPLTFTPRLRTHSQSPALLVQRAVRLTPDRLRNVLRPLSPTTPYTTSDCFSSLLCCAIRDQSTPPRCSYLTTKTNPFSSHFLCPLSLWCCAWSPLQWSSLCEIPKLRPRRRQ